MNIKKKLLTLGTVITIPATTIAAVSCGSDNGTDKYFGNNDLKADIKMMKESLESNGLLNINKDIKHRLPFTRDFSDISALNMKKMYQDKGLKNYDLWKKLFEDGSLNLNPDTWIDGYDGTWIDYINGSTIEDEENAVNEWYAKKNIQVDSKEKDAVSAYFYGGDKARFKMNIFEMWKEVEVPNDRINYEIRTQLNNLKFSEINDFEGSAVASFEIISRTKGGLLENDSILNHDLDEKNKKRWVTDYEKYWANERKAGRITTIKVPFMHSFESLQQGFENRSLLVKYSREQTNNTPASFATYLEGELSGSTLDKLKALFNHDIKATTYNNNSVYEEFIQNHLLDQSSKRELSDIKFIPHVNTLDISIKVTDKENGKTTTITKQLKGFKTT